MISINMEVGDPLHRDWIIRSRKSMPGGGTYSQISATSTLRSGNTKEMVKQLKVLNGKSLNRGGS